MAKRKVVGQIGERNMSGVSNTAWGRKTIMTKAKAQIGSGARSRQLKALSKSLDSNGFKVVVNSKRSAANAAGIAVKGNVAYVMYNSKKGIQVYEFNAKDKKTLEGIQHQVLLAASSRQRPRLTPGNNQSLSRFQQTLNAMGVPNVGGTRGDMGRGAQMKAIGVTYKGEASNSLKQLGIDLNAIHQIKEPTPRNKKGANGQQRTPTPTPNKNTGRQTFNKEIVTPVGGQEKKKNGIPKEEFKNLTGEQISEKEWGQMSKSQKFITMAKMSSPSFKGYRATAFAKNKERTAKNIARGIGIAGSALAGLGKGISKGYKSGWYNR